MFSRSSVLAAMRVLPYVRGDSGIISARPASGAGRVVLASGAILVSAGVLPVPTLAALIACIIFWRMSWKKIGGCTGDVLGATIEIGEIVFLLALAAETRLGLSWGALFPLLNLVR